MRFWAILEMITAVIDTINKMKYFISPLVVIYTENKVLKLFHKILNKKTNKS